MTECIFDKELPQKSPFTGKFFQMTTFCFGVYTVHQSMHSHINISVTLPLVAFISVHPSFHFYNALILHLKSLLSQHLQEHFPFLSSLYFQDFETRFTYFPSVKYVVFLSLSVSLCRMFLFHLSLFVSFLRGQIQRKPWCMGPYAGVDYNLTLCPLQSRLQHIYHTFIMDNPMPESTLTLCQSRLYPQQGLWIWPLLCLSVHVIQLFFSYLTPIPFRFVSHEATD